MRMEIVERLARKAIEDTYSGSCTIRGYRESKEEKTRFTKEEEVTVLEKQPCRVSFQKIASAAQTETAAAVSQEIKLFLAPEIVVKSGSKIVVTQNKRTTEYVASGEPAVYPTHQEIILELAKRWA